MKNHSTTVIADNLRQIQHRIHTAEQRYHRPAGSVKLLAVSKGQSLEKIEQAVDAGQFCFGENYIQEAIPKINALSKNIEWHFIGNIQANKTKQIAAHFAWVHSISRRKIAEKLNEHRSADLPPLNVCIEINIDHELSKSGIDSTLLFDLAAAIQKMPRLKLRGLMAIPQQTKQIEQQRDHFRQLRLLFEEMQKQGFNLDTLSMGMSNDFEAAIAEGSTLVRIGTSIFGTRT